MAGLRDEIFGIGSGFAKYIVFTFNIIFAVSEIFVEHLNHFKKKNLSIN